MKKNALIYIASNITSSIAPFILIPILTRTLSVEDYGLIALFQTLLPMMGIFIGLNVSGAIARKFYDKEDNYDFSTYVFSGLSIAVLSSTIISVFSFLLFKLGAGKIQEIMPLGILMSAILYSTLNTFNQVRLVIWQVRENAFKYAVFQLSFSFCLLISCLWLIYFSDTGPYSRIYSAIFTAAIFCSFSILFLYKYNELKLGIKLDRFREVLSFGLPLLPHSIGMIIINMADRYFISAYLGMRYLGLYMAVIQVSMVLSMIFDAINKAYVPWLFSNLNKNCSRTDRKIVSNTYKYMLVLIAIGMVGGVIGPNLFLIFVGEKYQEVSSFISIVVWTQVFYGMYLMVTNYIFYSRKNSKLSTVTIIVGVVNILLLIIFIPKYGLEGAIYIGLISSFARFICTWILASKVKSMPWSLYESKKNN
ncbi:oligosaccharide flippase family protein [Shewanella indica]|uniref:oligosaccharide flippase family protein n=1 Tax=Shewanella indica TaxID=768528 RepID=UPI000C34DB31|nr:oligosaccharide flippase family protein [Shewanella indica]GHB22037.1 polysaccharide biosynthesis protein [Shewanella indica]